MHIPYRFNNSKALAISSSLAWKNSKLSSEKNRWVIIGTYLVILRPYKVQFSSSSYYSDDRALAHNTKRKGDMGSSCLKPCLGMNIFLGKPFRRMEYDIELTYFIIQESNHLGSPFFLSHFPRSFIPLSHRPCSCPIS